MPLAPAPAAPIASAAASAAVVLATVFACVLGSAAAHAAGAHAHGIATLDIAVESRSISVRLESPLDNLIGFERAPRTDAERKRADAAVARLRAGGEMFVIDPAAQCRLAGVELASAALKLGDAKAEPGEHADIDAVYSFDCADAGKAAYIDTGLFEFARLQRLRVQVAAPQGQFKRDLVRPAKRIVLSR